jgi:hypothetical protein
VPYTLTWITSDQRKQTKTYESVAEAIRDAIPLKSAEIRDDSSGSVFRSTAIRDIHEAITRGDMNV